MARKKINITITDDNRDKGKVFVIEEMPSSQGEAWAMRAMLALMNNGVEIPDGAMSYSMAAMAEMGIRSLSGLKWEVAKPLLDEMFGCVQIMPDPSKTHVVRALIDQDIEEIQTRVKLRAEVWKLHADFFTTAAGWISQRPAGNQASTDSQSIATSPMSSPG